MNEELFKKFKEAVDTKFLDMQKNCAKEEDSRKYMETDEYKTEVNNRFGDVKDESNINGVAASCAYCLYMMY